MLDKNVEQALNAQINMEFGGSYFYLAMSVHLDQIHFTGFSSWMQKQSDEERAHGQRILQYVLARDGDVTLEAIERPKAEFGSVKEIFELALAQEQDNTKSINKIYQIAREQNDYATQAHLQWFIDEQVEEEKLFKDVLGRLEIAGDDRTALLLLDEQMSNRPPEADVPMMTNK